ncbi:SAV_2336 N-terminal domain-related protein [Anabaena sp. UHCC 0204]|uniref:SAV_2336 N-terminal domain-related protein n=1 Tax=Anabaena sp. UHCC 0204 TaxID=2590009 RepID=UPI0020C20027|nr:SAV_2336 N-terminal domain-related protein [Anabaena sp. UHCC 0204]
MSKQFDQFITTLEKKLNLTGTEIAEILWLAQQTCTHVSVDKEPTPQKKPPPSNEHKDIPPQTPNYIPITPPTSPTIIEPEPPKVPIIPRKSDSYPDSGLSINIPDVASLPYPRKIAKALSSLIQYIAYGKAVLLNEKATVERIAELNGICIPILEPRRELKFDLVLVIDKSDSMIFWQRIIKELQQILKNYGIFRNIQTFGIFTDDQGDIYLKQSIGKKETGKKRYSPRKLIDPTGRRIIFIVSDCVSEIWRNGKAFNLLKIWGKHNIVAIFQMLPERMWLRTALSSGAMVQLNRSDYTVANRNLSIKEILIWDDINFHQSIKVPVFSLTPDSIKTWSKMVIGKGTIGAGGFAFSDIVKQPELQEPQTQDIPQISLSHEERVYQFRMSSSPLARNLASLLASAPVINLPVVRLIQKNFLPQSEKIVHVIAEVFLGGILKPTKEITPDTNPDYVEYRFIHEEIRDIFLQDSSRMNSQQIIKKISEYIAEKLGKNLKEFDALLQNPEELEKLTKEKNLPDLNFEYFATITTKVLRRLGGDYTAFANEVEKAWTKTPPPENTLEEFIFTTATILITDKFDFEVATIELKKPRFNIGKPQLNVKRQPQQAEYFPEKLGDHLTLEMVSIPGDTFMMGSPPQELERRNSESPQHTVTVQPFFMGKYPVTQAQWRFVAELPQVNRELDPNPSKFKGDNRPVEQVSWYDAVEFCTRLSNHTKRPYSLPSEAQWEYACRAGTTTPFHFGETITTDLANYDGDYTYGDGVKGTYRKQTTEVGSFGVANNFGLYDMHGNVWEWCLDDWHDNYKGAPTDGSAWFDENTKLFDKSMPALLRGGSWYNDPVGCRSASRGNDVRAERDRIDYVIGFRVVCGVGRA